MAERTPSNLVAEMAEHYGVRLCLVGEEGNHAVALGHHEPRRFLAALNRHVRRDLGWRSLAWEWDQFSREVVLPTLERTYAVLATDCGEHDGAADPDCGYCKEIREAAWWLSWDAVTESTPGAFPVTAMSMEG